MELLSRSSVFCSTLSSDVCDSDRLPLSVDAFYIVWADAGLLVIAMLPLFFSTSLISVIGFSESTIIGALLGAFLTRPTYGSIISKHYSK